MDSTSQRHLVLVGLMATGKSTVGRRLAERLGRTFVDSDTEIEARTGRTVREIWLSEGEATFRVLEAEALASALQSATPSVIAAAGGVVLAEENRHLLASSDADVVWLRAAPETLFERITRADDTHRPLLDGDAAGMLETMATDRTPLYSAVAGLVVDVDDLSADAVVAAVLEAIEGPCEG